ncbi:MAG TPA: hypothetical protein VLV16_04405 [Gemmatimonadales bacterium]|nr:hypothetical protein [Gemmatimonadales bacterium]
MSRGGRYVVGLGVVATVAFITSRVAAPEWRAPLITALVLACMVQAPLGWWLIRSIGRRRFLAVWGVGIAARVALLAVMALVVAPARGWPLEPALVPLALVLVALIAVEAGALIGGSGAALG